MDRHDPRNEIRKSYRYSFHVVARGISGGVKSQLRIDLRVACALRAFSYPKETGLRSGTHDVDSRSGR
jgi:hypothetical protein